MQYFIRSNKERTLASKRAQEEALSRLPPYELFIVLYIRSSPPTRDDFHWSYYFHKTSGGFEYQVMNLNNRWIPDHGRTGGVLKANFLCVLIQIASIPQAKRDLLDETIRSRDKDITSNPGVTCRVWLMTILQRLIELGIVQCNDYNALEQECIAIGNEFSAGAAANNQPRPVVRSRVCL